MDILPEIIEVTNEMVDALDEGGFFENNPFIERMPLKRKLQNLMQRRWEEFDDYKLTWEEVEGVIQDVLNESVSNTIEDLMDKGALNMSINKDGEILYKANKDFNFDEL
jgi:hypothetical protein